MLEAENLLKALSTKENTDDNTYTYNNDDRDFGEVLKFCSGNTMPEHKIEYSDGIERILSFD